MRLVDAWRMLVSKLLPRLWRGLRLWNVLLMPTLSLDGMWHGLSALVLLVCLLHSEIGLWEILWLPIHGGHVCML